MASSRPKASALPPEAPRRPIRTADVPLELDGYPDGIKATMRMNPPLRDLELLGGTVDQIRAAMGRLVLEWNLPDETGAVVELDATVSGATDDELGAFIRGFYKQLRERSQLPKQG